RPCPPLGGRTHPLLDQPLPAHRQRLRTPARPPRRDGPMVHGHHHDPTTRPLPNHQPITDHTDHLTRFFNRLSGPVNSPSKAGRSASGRLSASRSAACVAATAVAAMVLAACTTPREPGAEGGTFTI